MPYNSAGFTCRPARFFSRLCRATKDVTCAFRLFVSFFCLTKKYAIAPNPTKPPIAPPIPTPIFALILSPLGVVAETGLVGEDGDSTTEVGEEIAFNVSVEPLVVGCDRDAEEVGPDDVASASPTGVKTPFVLISPIVVAMPSCNIRFDV